MASCTCPNVDIDPTVGRNAAVLSAPKRPEIDQHTMKLIVGVIAMSLAFLTNFFASSNIASISAAYHEGGWSQNFFVGFLFAISAFLLAYNGESRSEMILSKVAAVAALGVALFPCECDARDQVIASCSCSFRGSHVCGPGLLLLQVFSKSQSQRPRTGEDTSNHLRFVRHHDLASHTRTPVRQPLRRPRASARA